MPECLSLDFFIEKKKKSIQFDLSDSVCSEKVVELSG